MDENTDSTIQFLSMLLTPQREMIEAEFGELPEKAHDEYCLGYVVGTVDAIINAIPDNKHQPHEAIIIALYIAFGNGVSIGNIEQELGEKISELAGSLPSDYTLGKRDGMQGVLEFAKSAQSGIPMPDTRWFNHVKQGAF